MKIRTVLSSLFRKKSRFLIALAVILGIIGFLSGLLIGRMIGLLANA